MSKEDADHSVLDKNTDEFKFLFIYSPMSYVRTPRALDQHCYYPNKLHVYTQVQFLS